MNETKHTPGLWKNDNRDIRRADGELIASCRTKQIAPLEEEANARLISAAPELLDALDTLVSAIKHVAGDTCSDARLNPAFRLALQAVSKARGE